MDEGEFISEVLLQRPELCQHDGKIRCAGDQRKFLLSWMEFFLEWVAVDEAVGVGSAWIVSNSSGIPFSSSSGSSSAILELSPKGLLDSSLTVFVFDRESMGISAAEPPMLPFGV